MISKNYTSFPIHRTETSSRSEHPKQNLANISAKIIATLSIYNDKENTPILKKPIIQGHLNTVQKAVQSDTQPTWQQFL